MYAEISLVGTNGNNLSIPMEANATTAVRYKMLFGEELMKSLTKCMSGIMGANNEKDDEVMFELMGSEDFSCISKMGYIMHEQAEKTVAKATVEKYIEWLEQFDALAFLMGANEIISLYLGNKLGTSTPKKDTAPQTES